MKKLQAPALPVKAIGAPVAHGAEQAEPFVQRWLDMQRARLIAQLSVCESPIETIFAVALLGAVEESGPVLRLVESLVTHPARPIAVSSDGRVVLSAQHEIAMGRRVIRIDFTLCSRDKSVAIELNGHEFHSSKARLSGDASRDFELTDRGWTPLRFTGTDIWRDADECAARALKLIGIQVTRGPALRPAEKSPKKEAASTMEQSKEGASSVLAALAAMPEGPIPRPSTGKR